MNPADPKRWLDDPAAELQSVRRLLSHGPPLEPLDSATALRVKRRVLQATAVLGAAGGNQVAQAASQPTIDGQAPSSGATSAHGQATSQGPAGGAALPATPPQGYGRLAAERGRPAVDEPGLGSTAGGSGLRPALQRTVARWLGVPATSLGPVGLALLGSALTGAAIAYVAVSWPSATGSSAHRASPTLGYQVGPAAPSPVRSARGSDSQPAAPSGAASKHGAPSSAATSGAASDRTAPGRAASSRSAVRRQPASASAAAAEALGAAESVEVTEAGASAERARSATRHANPSPSPPQGAARRTATPRSSAASLGRPDPHALRAPSPAAAPAAVGSSRAALRQGPARAGSPEAPERARVDSLREETRLLEAAKSQLARKPREALALSRRHQHRFRGGQLIEQRRLIQLEALLRLGQEEEAVKLSRRLRLALSKSRANALLERYGVVER